MYEENKAIGIRDSISNMAIFRLGFGYVKQKRHIKIHTDRQITYISDLMMYD